MDYHQPVLTNEIINLLAPRPNKIFLDATLGHGGHTIKLLENGATVYGLDADPKSLIIAQKRIGNQKNFHPILGNFKDLAQIFRQHINQPLHGIIFDLGLNLYQLKYHHRGFSFNDDSPLDMRLNENQSLPTAGNLINRLPQKELSLIFSKYAQQPFSHEIGQVIADRRRKQKITTAKELSQIIQGFYRQKKISSPKHPATLIFLALRVAVNQEFTSLSQALDSCLSISLPQTIVALISFHSGEDRIIKNFIRQHRLPTGPTIKPTTVETQKNPLARSAMLRWFKPGHDQNN